jgi:hypothetical protein
MSEMKETSMPETFKSADGSTRCVRCHLHPDECTCDPNHPLWQILAGAFDPYADLAGSAMQARERSGSHL